MINKPGAVSEQVRREATLLMALPVCAAQDGGPVSVRAGSRQQLELLRAFDRCPTVVHPELAVEVLGVGAHSVQGDGELAGDLGTVQIGSEQPQHVELAIAQRLDLD